MRRRVIFPALLLLGVLGFGPGQVSAQSTVADSIDTIVDEIESSGRFVDPAALPLGDGVDSAIDRANAAGIAVVFPEPAADAEALALVVDEAMQSSGSRFDAVLVLTPAVIAAQAGDVSEAELGAALDASFVNSDDTAAIDAFVTSLSGGEPPESDVTNDATPIDTTPNDSAADSSGSGGGIPWLGIVLLAIVAFFGIRFFTNRRKRSAAEAAALEVDRDEIAEQLRNNADRVIDLGDPVIATADAELIALYEEASRTYQEVSLALPDATTAAEIDALDDRIDRAEWQLEVIAARLAGSPEPPSPETRAPTTPAAPGPHEPALQADESVFDRRHDRASSTRLPPPSSPRRSTAGRRSSGGGLGGAMGGGSMGGGMGGILGSILGQILLGSGRPRTTSRRTQRRAPSSGSGGSLGPFGSSGGSFPDPFSRTRRSSGSSGGRSRPSARAGGSRTRSASTRRSGGARRR